MTLQKERTAGGLVSFKVYAMTIHYHFSRTEKGSKGISFKGRLL